VKYAIKGQNKKIEQNFKLSTQLLHAYKLCFDDGVTPLEYMKGLEIKADLPANFKAIGESLFGNELGEQDGTKRR